MSIETFVTWCIEHAISFSLEQDDQLKVHAAPGQLTSEVVQQLKARKTELITWIKQQQQDIPQEVVVGESIREDCTRITPEQLRLIKLSQEDIDQIVAQVPGGIRNIQDIYPLAPVQEGMLFHHRMNEERDPYVSPTFLVLKDQTAFEQFVQAMEFIVQRHDALRTLILWRQVDHPVQVVYRDNKIKVSLIEQIGQESLACTLNNLTEQAFHRLDLEQLPSVHLYYGVDPDNGDHHVFFLQHHLFVDHVAFDIIYEELFALMSGELDRLAVPRPYRQFIAHVSQQMASREYDLFFKDYLAPLTHSTLLLGPPSLGKNEQSYEESQTTLARTLNQQIRQLSKAQKVSEAAIFHAAFGLVVHLFTQQQRPCFGSVMLGRLQQGEYLDHMVGMTINTLPFIIDLADMTATEYLAKSHDILLQLLAYDFVPLTQIRSYAQNAISHQDSPLFDAIINYRHTQREAIEAVDDLLGIKAIHGVDKTHYPLTLSIDDVGYDFDLSIKCRTEANSALTIEQIQHYYLHALQVMVEAIKTSSDIAVDQLLTVSHADRDQQLYKKVNASTIDPEFTSLAQLFEQQVSTTPHEIAVSDDHQTLSYMTLNRRVNQLAYYLQNTINVSSSPLIGVSMLQSVETIIAIIAILKVGGAYVPLPPDHPEPRLRLMINDSAIKTIICDENGLERLKEFTIDLVCLESQLIQEQLSRQPIDNKIIVRKPENSLQQLAYIIYTSGSTGIPKGVLVEQRGVIHLAKQLQQEIVAYSKSRRWGWLVSYAFDGSVKGLLALLTGCQLVIVPAELRVAGEELLDYLKHKQVDIVDGTPSLMTLLLSEEKTKALVGQFNWALGGEPINAAIWTELATVVFDQGKHAFNLYGPTEATVNATWTEIHAQQAPHIGRPLKQVELILLNNNQLVPIGGYGEICLGGPGIARGYLNQSELTTEKFIKNPYLDQGLYSKTLYRTGDLARWQKDGTLQYLGRNDQQVKIRGYRIELGEIEAALLAQIEIRTAIVISHYDQSGQAQLVAYYSQTSTLDTTSLRTRLNQILPEFMVPNLMIPLKTFPLTHNGKIDIAALPAPNANAMQQNYIAPSTAVERQLCALWQELLQVDSVGVNDNFFLLGGHSLLLTRLITRMRKVFALPIPLKSVYIQPNLQALAQWVEQAQQTQQEQQKYLKRLAAQRKNIVIKKSGVL